MEHALFKNQKVKICEIKDLGNFEECIICFSIFNKWNLLIHSP